MNLWPLYTSALLPYLGLPWSLQRGMVAQLVKNLPAVKETQVQSLGQEDPLEKGMATHFSTLAWRISWMEERGGLQSMGSHTKSRTRLSAEHFPFCFP